MNPRILLVVALVAQSLITGAAYAENKAGGRPPGGQKSGGNAPGKPPEKKEHTQEHTTITSISAESVTISEGGKAKTFKITKDTEITLKGQKVKPEDLKAGMRVSVNMGSDTTVASRINASDAPKEESHGDDKSRGGDGKGDKGKAGGDKKK
jgi:hypothetical protein